MVDGTPVHKTCARCGESKPRSEFNKAKASRDGLFSYCRSCSKAACQESYSRNRAARLAKQREYDTEHRPEKLVRLQAHYQANRVERCAARRAAYAEDPVPAREAALAWEKANPERRQAHRRARRAQMAPGDGVSDEQWRAVLAAFDGCCAYCGADGKQEMDHVVPLSRGGPHDVTNVVPACKPCNSSKGARTLAEWRPDFDMEALMARLRHKEAGTEVELGDGLPRSILGDGWEEVSDGSGDTSGRRGKAGQKSVGSAGAPAGRDSARGRREPAAVPAPDAAGKSSD